MADLVFAFCFVVAAGFVLAVGVAFLPEKPKYVSIVSGDGSVVVDVLSQ